MGRELREADLRALLEVVAIEPGESAGAGLPCSMLERVRRLIECEAVSFIDFDPATQQAFLDQEFPAGTFSDIGDDGAFFRHYWDFMPCSYPSHTGDERSVIMTSDFCTQRQFHQTGMYAEYLSKAGVEHELIMCLPTPGSRTRRLLFARGHGAGFSERDRLLLTILRPHLIETYRQLDEMRRPAPQLTRRQWQLLRLVAAGHSNAEIAERLFVSPLTVRKHLENIFERLGVTNRTAATAVAFPQAQHERIDNARPSSLMKGV